MCPVSDPFLPFKPGTLRAPAALGSEDSELSMEVIDVCCRTPRLLGKLLFDSRSVCRAVHRLRSPAERGVVVNQITKGGTDIRNEALIRIFGVVVLVALEQGSADLIPVLLLQLT